MDQNTPQGTPFSEIFIYWTLPNSTAYKNLSEPPGIRRFIHPPTAKQAQPKKLETSWYLRKPVADDVNTHVNSGLGDDGVFHEADFVAVPVVPR